MISGESSVALIYLVLAAGIGATFLSSRLEVLLWFPVATAAYAFGISIPLLIRFETSGAFTLFNGLLLIDGLSLFHVILVHAVFLFTALYATGYFKTRIESASLTLGYAKRYGMLWQSFHGMLLLVLLSNHIGLMWVAMEATTLVSAFLILSSSNSLSIEAMWKYLLICSVGIVFAFMGTLLTVDAARQIQAPASILHFSELHAHAAQLDPKLMLLAFIFLVVGFGTKAGLAPMHTWLPDAHSQSPTPVSAVFSGIMLSCALYCILRYLPITDATDGNAGQAHSILLVFGVLSLVFAAAFIPVQQDVKRMLAYCSVEHIGIVALGMGLGGPAVFAALLHTVNHSLSKSLAFFAAGHIGDQYRSRDMKRISGTVAGVPLWGSVLFVSVLALIGVAPFALFLSEFLIFKEAFHQGRYTLFAGGLICMSAIFMSMLQHAMHMCFGANGLETKEIKRPRYLDRVLVTFLLVALVLLGLWIPAPYSELLRQASAAIENGIAL